MGDFFLWYFEILGSGSQIYQYAIFYVLSPLFIVRIVESLFENGFQWQNNNLVSIVRAYLLWRIIAYLYEIGKRGFCFLVWKVMHESLIFWFFVLVNKTWCIISKENIFLLRFWKLSENKITIFCFSLENWVKRCVSLYFLRKIGEDNNKRSCSRRFSSHLQFCFGDWVI